MKDIPLRRSMAFLMDMGIVSTVIAISENLFPVTTQTHEFDVSGIAFTMGITLTPVFYGVYFSGFDVINKGQTLGKLLWGILVVSKTGETLHIKKRLERSLYKMLGMLILPVAVVLFLFRGYTLQDHYTNTKTRIAWITLCYIAIY